jgi:hypothetical protein
MEIIQIKSAHSLVPNLTGTRMVEAHSYTLNCHQYLWEYQKWQKSIRTPAQVCDIMTLDYVRISITELEGKQIEDAIRAAHSPIQVD